MWWHFVAHLLGEPLEVETSHWVFLHFVSHLSWNHGLQLRPDLEQEPEETSEQQPEVQVQEEPQEEEQVKHIRETL